MSAPGASGAVRNQGEAKFAMDSPQELHFQPIGQGESVIQHQAGFVIGNTEKLLAVFGFESLRRPTFHSNKAIYALLTSPLPGYLTILFGGITTEFGFERSGR